MKKFNLSVGVMLFFFFAFVQISCKKDSSTNPSISSVLTSGQWKVSYYVDPPKNETSDFANYVFVFNSNGQLTISGSTIGTWSVFSSDDNGGSQKLNLVTGNINPLNKLNHDWMILSTSESKVELMDDSNNGEVLHFSKI